MELYGLAGIALNWVKRYLSNRMQVVQINGITSYEREIVCWSPRGIHFRPIVPHII